MLLIERINDPRQMQLSNTQKTVIATVINAPTSKIAHDRINDLSLLTAASLLSRMGVLSINSYAIKLTDLGMEVARLSNLVDDVGQLTDDANKLISVQQESYTYKILNNLISG